VGAVVCVSSYLLIGCVGDLVEIKGSTSNDDMNAEVDAGQDMDVVELGPPVTPHFFPDIQADLDAKNCAIAGCHLAGSQMPTLVKSPTTQADKDANYNNIKAIAIDATAMSDPTKSALLLKLLPGATHGGGVLLPSTSDPVYKRWLAWIAGGGPK
jgi:hypothetical protein